MRITGSHGFSLYFHIPYCKRRCPYCHFYTVADDESSKDRLLDAFISEIHLREPSIHQLNESLESIYFGGGTPSLFGPARIQKIINHSLSFATSPIEITLEANPEHLNAHLLKQYYEAGVNRLSIGAQTFDDTLLKKLGRGHTKDQLIACVETAHDVGFENISIDLMYEIPGQELSHWQNSLETACSLPIHHLSIYNLTIEPGTSFFKRQSKLQKQIPKEDECERMWDLLCSYLPQMGWDHYEISAFARDGKRSQHNLGYWLGRPFYGLGPSAFSYWDQARFQNKNNLEAYILDIEKGALKSAYYEKLPKNQATAERIAIALRTSMGVNLNSFEVDTSLQKSIDELLKQELATYHESTLKLTTKGRKYYDSVGQIMVESYL